MLRISKLADYAVMMMALMAENPSLAYNAKNMAKLSHVALPTVSKVLKTLASSGLLSSVRGAKGGYKLALPPEQIGLKQIIAAIDGELALTECSHPPAPDLSGCRVENSCHIRHNWRRINRTILQYIAGIHLSDMLSPHIAHKVLS